MNDASVLPISSYSVPHVQRAQSSVG